MNSAIAGRVAGVATVCLSLVVFTASAAAAPSNPFGCRASVTAVRPAQALPPVEPYAANRAETPCATDTAGASQGTTGSAAGGSVATAGPGAAYTYSTTTADQTTGAIAPGATALVSVDGGSLSGSGDSVVVAGPAQAQASYSCVNGALSSSGSSNVTAAIVNGQRVQPSSPGAEQTEQLGGGSYVTINQQVKTATSLTERLVFVHLAGVGDLVLGEAQVTLSSSDPCAGTSGSGGGASGSGSGSGGGSLSACPAGSILLVSTQLCEIVVPGGQDIIVSAPFKGPTGGTVISLAAARGRYKSACLSGPGPKFAVVGTNAADRINGTSHGDRILGLGGNDRIAGGGGNDCIDGGPGNDRIWGGNGKDRIYGASGNDRISVQGGSSYVNAGAGKDRVFLGNGSDRVYGGPGNDRIAVGRGRDHVYGGAGRDTITTGDGNDWVYGNAGNDRIYVGNGKDHVFGGNGNDRLYGPGPVVYMRGGRGRDVCYVNATGARYAKRHGCEKVRKIRARTLH